MHGFTFNHTPQRVLGSKMSEFRSKSSLNRGGQGTSTNTNGGGGGANSGIELVPVSDVRRARFCLSDETAKEVGASIERINATYRLLFDIAEVDTEFAVDQAGRLLMLQSRPVVDAVREVSCQ